MKYRRKYPSLTRERVQVVEEQLLGALREASPKGLTNRQIHILVGDKVDVVSLGRLLDRLLKLKLIKEANVVGGDENVSPGYIAIPLSI